MAADLPLDAVKHREESIRKDTHVNVVSLAQSIVRSGRLLNPITVSEDYYIVQGRRRFNAFAWLNSKDMCVECLHTQEESFKKCPRCQCELKISKAKYSAIPYTMFSGTQWERQVSELEENLEREDLTSIEIAEARTSLNNAYKSIAYARKKRAEADATEIERLRAEKPYVSKKLEAPREIGGLDLPEEGSEPPPEKAPEPEKPADYFEQRAKEASEKWADKDTAEKIGISPALLSRHKLTMMFVSIYPDLRDHEAGETGVHREFFKRRREAIRQEIARRRKGREESLPAHVETGDGLTLLKALEAESFDIILCDVPYGLEVEKTSGQEIGVAAEWDDKLRSANEFLRGLIPEIDRILRPNTHAFVFCSWEQTFIIRDVCEALQVPDEIHVKMEAPPCIWDKLTPLPAIDGSKAHDKRYEMYVHLRKGSPETDGRLGADVKAAHKIKQPKYPTEKPVELLQSILRPVVQPGWKLLDPCCGSGSSLIAGLELGLEVTGYDLNPKAIEITQSRIALEIEKR